MSRSPLVIPERHVNCAVNGGANVDLAFGQSSSAQSMGNVDLCCSTGITSYYGLSKEMGGETSRARRLNFESGELFGSRMFLCSSMDAEKGADVGDVNVSGMRNFFHSADSLALEDLLAAAGSGLKSTRGKPVSLMPNAFVIRDDHKTKVELG